MHKILSASIALAVATPIYASADGPPITPSEIQSLRQDIESMRTSYEARLRAMEQRLAEAERVIAAPPPVAADTALNIPSTVPPAETASGGGANAFNPAMSLILSGGYTRTGLDPASYKLSGFQLPVGTSAGPGSRGFSLAESELGLAANIDPWLRGVANISLHPDDTVSVEEAFVQTTALNHGLSFKTGRFLSGVGYLNSQHAHTWDFVDSPLAYQAMLGTQYADDGVQFHWLAPTDQYLELGAELGRGRSFPGSDSARNGAGMNAVTIHSGGDVGDSHSWRAGLSVLNALASDQNLGTMDTKGNLVTNTFNGSTRVWVLDGVWKWAPNGNATQTNFKLQGEYLHSTRSGNLTWDVSNANLTDAYSAAQSGWYVQGIYQFMPRWRVGLRTERLNPGTPDYGLNATSIINSSYQPSKYSLMFDFSPSEFSRVRLQVAQDNSRQGLADSQVFIQYQMSLGAHGAHSY